MPNHATREIRNVAVVGHGGSGKTTIVESLLAAAGAIGAAGSVEKGTAVCDYEPEERAHQQSLWNAIASLDHDSAHVCFVDTPGYPDFLGRALPGLAAVETAAVVVDARSGIQTTSRRMMEAAAARGLARLVVVNKIDAPDLDLAALVESLREVFGSECLPLNLPAPGREHVVDCFFDPDPSASTEFSSVEEAQSQVVDQAVEMDEELMETYLEEGEVTADDLRGAFRSALLEGHLIPVCFVSAVSGAGIDLLLDVLARLMPSPADASPPTFAAADGAAVAVEPDPQAGVMAEVFRVTIDPFVGKLSAFRIHAGTVTRDSQLHIDDGRKPFKVGHLFRLQGKEHVEIGEGGPGDICAVAKVDDISYGAMLHSAGGDVPRPEPVPLPEAMYGLAVQAKTRGDEQKLSDTLGKLAAEDPSFHVEHSTATRETVIRGLGELHLRMMLERMKERYNVEVETRPPRIPYRETITAPAEGHHRHKKQTGGAGQFGEVFLRVEPKARGRRLRVRRQRRRAGSSRRSSCLRWRRGSARSWSRARSRATGWDDVKVTVYDGKHHPVDSKEIAFVMAGKKAFLDAVNKARPDRARAGGGPGGDGSPGQHGGHRRGSLGEAGAGRRDREPRRRVRGDHRPGPVERADPLPDRAEVGHRRRGQLHHGVQPLRSGAAPHPGEADGGVQAGRRRGLSGRSPVARRPPAPTGGPPRVLFSRACWPSKSSASSAPWPRWVSGLRCSSSGRWRGWTVASTDWKTSSTVASTAWKMPTEAFRRCGRAYRRGWRNARQAHRRRGEGAGRAS